MGNNPTICNPSNSSSNNSSNNSSSGPSNKTIVPSSEVKCKKDDAKCQNDFTCKNIDSKRSTTENIVFVCPNAEYLDGACNCGQGCEKDPYTGMCCTKVERDDNGNYYCIEEPYILGNEQTKQPSNSSLRCNIPNQMINGIHISGQQICDIYNKYQ